MKQIIPKTFHEYEADLKNGNKTITTAYSEGELALSPFAGGKGMAIPAQSRAKLQSIAHPVDSTLVKILDKPLVNAALNKIVQTSVDYSESISLSQGLHVTPKTRPDIYEIVEECAQTLGAPIPYVVISGDIPGLNACTAGTDQFAYIQISSLLTMLCSKEQLKFIIGHEMGHIVMSHVIYHTAGRILNAASGTLPFGRYLSSVVSLALNAWNRRSEITADRAGLLCCGDIEVAKRALIRLNLGFYNTDNIDIDEFVRESERVLQKSTIGKANEYAYNHPLISKRIQALDLFARSDAYADAMGIERSKDGLTKEDLDKLTDDLIAVYNVIELLQV